jgi:hypothetical protein
MGRQGFYDCDGDAIRPTTVLLADDQKMLPSIMGAGQ